MQQGDEAPVLELVLGRTDLVRYAEASGDFNPMHTDEVKAQKAKLPSVFGHGMLSMGILGEALNDFVGTDNLRRYAVRFVKQTWPGETLRTRVVVDRIHSDDGVEVVELTCSLENADGEVKVTGDATAVHR